MARQAFHFGVCLGAAAVVLVALATSRIVAAYEGDDYQPAPVRTVKYHHYAPIIIPIGAIIYLCRLCARRCGEDPAPRTSVRILSAGGEAPGRQRREAWWHLKPRGRRGLISQEQPPARDDGAFLPMESPVQQGTPLTAEGGATPPRPPPPRRWWAPWEKQQPLTKAGEQPLDPPPPPPPASYAPPPRPPPPQTHWYPGPVASAPPPAPAAGI